MPNSLERIWVPPFPRLKSFTVLIPCSANVKIDRHVKGRTVGPHSEGAGQPNLRGRTYKNIKPKERPNHSLYG